MRRMVTAVALTMALAVTAPAASAQGRPLGLDVRLHEITSEFLFEDYTWTKPATARFGGKADAYARMLVEELRPAIDEAYRTLPGAGDTALGGASLGASCRSTWA